MNRPAAARITPVEGSGAAVASPAEGVTAAQVEAALRELAGAN